jgi:hypothetical protein
MEREVVLAMVLALVRDFEDRTALKVELSLTLARQSKEDED